MHKDKHSRMCSGCYKAKKHVIQGFASAQLLVEDLHHRHKGDCLSALGLAAFDT